MTPTPALTTETIVSALNAYEGDNIWQDLILDIADEAATDAIDQGTNDQFVDSAGIAYRYDGQRAQWDTLDA